ncbi:hypothetical protein [Roseimaritima sediminicola]|uniref:hypothetical protein n=1 Tax=Roseimaritima sediminicola TaxID=2662066 RepID=UPI0036F1CF8F
MMLSTAAILLALGANGAVAQRPTSDAHAGHNHRVDNAVTHPASTRTAQGPRGGTLRQAGPWQLETVVTQAGIQMHVYDASGTAVRVDSARGAARLRIEGNAKRYRYDLLPDGRGSLTAPVNLSKIAGRQIEVEVTLLGLGQGPVSLTEVATVPASEAQLAAAAIARQKICPVSSKPLGSMGDPVAVALGGDRVFVCCASCVGAVESNPAKYVSGRPEVTVASATKADADTIARQKVCPVMDEPLGSMGTPVKVSVGDKPIFLCCKGCVKKIQAEPAKYLARVYGNPAGGSPNATATPAAAVKADAASQSAVVPAGTEAVRAGVFKVSGADKPFIAAQKKCPVMDEPLDAMGGPYKVHAAGRAIYICCPGCAKRIAADPQKYLKALEAQGVQAPKLR